MGVERGEGSNRWRAGALRADWTKRGRVWILPFVAKLHNGKSIGAGRAAAAPRDPPGTPGWPRPPPPQSAGPGLRSGGERRGLRAARAGPRGPPRLRLFSPGAAGERPLDTRARGCPWGRAEALARAADLTAPPALLARVCHSSCQGRVVTGLGFAVGSRAGM